MKAEPQENAGRIPELDGLRGLAILLVVSLHNVAGASGGEFGSFLYRFKQVFRLGWSGVDLFFVLSGFLIGGILLRARDSQNYYSVFYLRRVHRIFPIYYLWIVLYFPIHIVGQNLIPNTIPGTEAGIRSISIYLLFLQNFISRPLDFDWRWLAVTWSLGVEEQFYLIAPVLIRALSRVSLIYMLGITVVLAPVLRELVYRFSPHSFYWTTLMPCRADTLAIGILAAIAWNDKSVRAFLSAKSKIIYRVLIFLFCGLPILLKYFPGPESQVTGVLGYSWLALFYVTLLFTVLVDSNGKLARIMRWRWLMKLGGISYCVYLIHIPINEILHASLLRSAPSIASLSGIGVTLLAVVLTLGIAVLSWKYFEEPMVRRGHRFRYNFKNLLSPAPVPLRGDVQSAAEGGV